MVRVEQKATRGAYDHGCYNCNDHNPASTSRHRAPQQVRNSDGAAASIPQAFVQFANALACAKHHSAAHPPHDGAPGPQAGRSIAAGCPNIRAGWSCFAIGLAFWREAIDRRPCRDAVANLHRLRAGDDVRTLHREGDLG